MIDELSLHNFRNIEMARLEFSDDFNVIFGPNGSGKTSIFEAIFFSGFGSSPSNASISDVILHGRDKAAIHAKGASGKLSIMLEKGGQKRVMVDDKKINKMSDILGIFPQTTIGPEEVQLVNGAPSARRKIIDMHLCQVNGVYVDALRNYTNVLSKRNALLKDAHKSSESLFEAIDLELTTAGEIIIKERREFVEGVKEKASEIYGHISLGKLELEYQPSFGGNSEEFAEELKRQRKKELRYGSTSIGPHRDELILVIDNKVARDFASWGQKRIASIVLLIAMSEYVHGQRNRKPSILLDDCFAELDIEKTGKLIEIAPQWGQVFIATPKKMKAPVENAAYFEFDNPGLIRKVNGI